MAQSTAQRSPLRDDRHARQTAFRRYALRRQADGHLELIRGRIVVTPPAGWTHGSLESGVVSLLDGFVRKNRLGRVFGSSTGYEFPSGDTVEPDASYISKQRWHEGPEPRSPSSFLRIVPNLVVEILSAKTRGRDLTTKKRIYEANGVNEYWIVDSVGHSLSVFFLTGGHYEPGSVFTCGTLRSRVLPGLSADVTELLRP